MILISYDIKDDKLRNQLSKYIKKFGYRVQYSVFEITHSDTMLKKIKARIEHEFEKKFSDSDSVLIIETSATCKITRFGYAKHDESDGIIIVK
jgi:CRISPR-associated protein Cas2